MNQINPHSNNKFIYNYTKECLESSTHGLERVNQKLTTILGFSAVLIKFAGELKTNSQIPLLIVTKWGAIACLFFSILCCLFALYSKTTGGIVSPKELVDDWWYEDEDSINLFILHQYFETIDSLDETYDYRSNKLNASLAFIGCAAFLFSINYLLT